MTDFVFVSINNLFAFVVSVPSGCCKHFIRASFNNVFILALPFKRSNWHTATL